MISQTEIREAIRSALIADDELEALLYEAGAVYHRVAPQGAVAPFVVFFKQAGLEVWDFGPGFYLNQLWCVKGICRGGDAEQAEAIDARCEAILDGAGVSVAGAAKTTVFRESDVEYGELDEGDQVHHVGGSYRLEVM